MIDPAHTPVKDTPVTADANTRIEARLNHIEHSIDKIAEHQNVSLIDNEGPPKKANKPLIAAAFGFAGLKLGGFTLGKFGLSADLVNAYHRNKMDGLTDAIQSVFNAADKEKGISKNLPFMFAGTILGATVGAVGGTLLGWNRGDRLRNAGELFTHPFDSMRKIFSSKPIVPAVSTKVEVVTEPIKEIHVTVQTQSPAVVSPAQHEGTVHPAQDQQLAH